MQRFAHLSRALVLLLCCGLLFLGGCAGTGDSAAVPSQAAASNDPFSDDDALDYLTAEDVEGQTVVGEDYFDDDDDYLKDYSEQQLIPDPLEPWNRMWFGFNDIILEYAARPISKAYDFVVPEAARTGLKNFFYNLRAPVRITNCLLQGKGMKAGVEFSSFFLNTLAGFGGFFDIASQYEPVVPRSKEDLGQTLGVWGVGEGLYLVWPLMGPSNVRDTLGTVGDYFIGKYTNPISLFADDLDWRLEIGISGLSALNSLGEILSAYDAFKGIAVDPYTAMRDGYTKLRRSSIEK